MNGSFVLDQSLTFPLPSIPPGGRTSVTVRFNAPSIPGERLATRWEIITQPSSSPPVTLDVVGMSAGPRIEVLPDFVDFGRVHQLPGRLDVVIRNIGTGDLGVRSARLQTGTEFRIVAGAFRSLVIPAAQEHRLTLEFNPQAAGLYNDTLIVSSQDPTRPRITNMIQAVLL